jgi:hypothetical protein
MMSSPFAGEAEGFGAGGFVDCSSPWGEEEAAGVGSARGGGVASVAGVTGTVGEGEASPEDAPVWAISGAVSTKSRIRK